MPLLTFTYFEVGRTVAKKVFVKFYGMMQLVKKKLKKGSKHMGDIINIGVYTRFDLSCVHRVAHLFTFQIRHLVQSIFIIDFEA